MSATASLQKSSAINAAVLQKAAPAKRASEQAQDSVTSNPFFQVAFGEADPEAKVAAMKALLVSTLDSKKDRANEKAFEEFKEFLSQKSIELSKQIISLTNVEVLSKLNGVIKDMNTDLLSFEEQMKPIMEIIDTIHELNTNGTMLDVFKDIEADRAAEEERARRKAELQAEQDRIQEEMRRLQDENSRLNADKGFFGMGTVKKESRARQEVNNGRIQEMRTRAADLSEQVRLIDQAPEMSEEDAEKARHKRNLRSLIDMTDDQNRQRMIGLRDTAISFIETSQARTGDLRGQFDSMSEQVAHVEDSTHGMQRLYAIMNDALVGAKKENLEKRAPLAEGVEGESMMAKTTREERLRALDVHMTGMARVESDTMMSFADLTQQADRVDTMRNMVNEQINTAAKISNQGVSATAERIAMAITSVAAASLNEANTAANNTLQAMRDSTSEITSRQTIHAAMGAMRLNEGMAMMVEELARISEVKNVANDITRNGMLEMRSRMEEMAQKVGEAQENLKKGIAMAATVGSEEDTPGTSAAPVASDNLLANV